MEPLPVLPNCTLAFKYLNKRLAMLDGPGKCLRWIRELALKDCSVEDVFKRTAGVLAADFLHSMIHALLIMTITNKSSRCVRHFVPPLPPGGH